LPSLTTIAAFLEKIVFALSGSLGKGLQESFLNSHGPVKREQEFHKS
jgi:hypothetical protein